MCVISRDHERLGFLQILRGAADLPDNRGLASRKWKFSRFRRGNSKSQLPIGDIDNFTRLAAHLCILVWPPYSFPVLTSLNEFQTTDPKFFRGAQK